MPEQETTFIHTVFFWLKDDITNAEKMDFEKGLMKLGTVPQIRKFYRGVPAGTPRNVVDNTWDYSWIVHFAGPEDQNIYQGHPVHLEFVEKYQQLWSEVRVFDSVLILKS